ncbi:transposase [Thermogemmatispora aurantia]|uniref:transposase n=1 Tax=Thermogemmatispora aurantia TaxID=2045279 RepID=UPI001478C341|nr:transposase [Thermogemmatispora aurantia]
MIPSYGKGRPSSSGGPAGGRHSRPLLLGYRVHTLLCRGTGLPLLFLPSPANVHDAPLARPLLAWTVRLFQVRSRVIHLDAGSWGLKLIAWIHTVLGARAVLPWTPKRQKRRNGLPPTWIAEEPGKRTSIERFFGRTFICFRLQRPLVFGWSAVAMRVAPTDAALGVIALAAWQAGRLEDHCGV